MKYNDGAASSPLPLSQNSMEQHRRYSLGDNSSIIWTLDPMLTTTVKRFIARICDLAETRAPRPSGKATRGSAFQMPEPLVYEMTMAQKKTGVRRQQGEPRKKIKPSPEQSRFFPVVTSNLLNMICVTTVFAAVLADSSWRNKMGLKLKRECARQ